MSENFIDIKKRHLRGEDGTTVISLRLSNDLLEKLNGIATEANYSRNELIQQLLEKAVQMVRIKD